MQPIILVTSRRFIYIYIIWVIDRAGIRPRHAQNVTLVLFCAVVAIALRHHPAQSQRRTSALVFLHLPDSKARYSRVRDLGSSDPCVVRCVLRFQNKRRCWALKKAYFYFSGLRSASMNVGLCDCGIKQWKQKDKHYLTHFLFQCVVFARLALL